MQMPSFNFVLLVSPLVVLKGWSIQSLNGLPYYFHALSYLCTLDIRNLAKQDTNAEPIMAVHTCHKLSGIQLCSE